MAMSLVLGAGIPIGKRDDLMITQGGTTIEGGLRTSIGYRRFALNLDGLGFYTPNGRYEPTNSEIQTTVIGVKTGAMASWRWTSWLRQGVAQRLQWQRIKGRDDSEGTFDTISFSRAPATTFIELAAPMSWGILGGTYLSAEVGIDWTDNTVPASDRMVAGGTLSYVF
jgi:hypothetical protein